MYIVTGGAGFIGSNIINSLNNRGIFNILAVDNLKNGDKFKNISLLKISHYMDKDDFLHSIRSNALLYKDKVIAVFHQGACSDTLNHDGKYMMSNNYQYSLDLLNWCQDNNISLIYASSAAVYGKGKCQSDFTEDSVNNENPLNIYGYSKLLFDSIVRNRINSFNSQVVGLRYFNVYGMNEEHKGKMSSMVLQGFKQYQDKKYIELFGKYDEYNDGEQLRDFIFIKDVVKINLFFLDHPNISGIFNVGTGNSYTFNQLAVSLINSIDNNTASTDYLHHNKKIQYKTFPNTLKGKYQSFTQANIYNLRQYYKDGIYDLHSGIYEYVKYLKNIL